jgi:hypothetical protein
VVAILDCPNCFDSKGFYHRGLWVEIFLTLDKDCVLYSASIEFPGYVISTKNFETREEVLKAVNELVRDGDLSNPLG